MYIVRYNVCVMFLTNELLFSTTTDDFTVREYNNQSTSDSMPVI